jgi:hypothetical protein
MFKSINRIGRLTRRADLAARLARLLFFDHGAGNPRGEEAIYDA